MNNGKLNLESQKLEQLKAEYAIELEALVTEQGIWNDITTYFVTGEKLKMILLIE